jgi:hypothetical protein
MKLLENIFWKIVPFTLPIIFFSIIGLIIRHYILLVPTEDIRETVGTIIGYTQGGNNGRSAIVKFSSKRKFYYTNTDDYYYVGEKFIIEYDEKNPKANTVRLDKPVFFKNEKTGFTIGIVDTYNPNYFREISFIYFVNGKKYEQSYKPVENSEVKYPDLREGKKYKVKYWEDYPKRSIILLDDPHDGTDISSQR